MGPANIGAYLFISIRDGGVDRATAEGLSCTPGDLWPLVLRGEIVTTQR